MSDVATQWISIDTAVDPDDLATVRGMVERRLEGDERAQVLSMLFDDPHSVAPRTLTQVNEGHPLPPDAKALILELVAAELSDSAIADQLGVSRQAVTGVRTAADRRARVA